jgi:hypothetical protein
MHKKAKKAEVDKPKDIDQMQALVQTLQAIKQVATVLIVVTVTGVASAFAAIANLGLCIFSIIYFFKQRQFLSQQPNPQQRFEFESTVNRN